jgi:hypothetical protein
MSDPSPRHDGDLLYLTDTAYFALLDHEPSGHRLPSNKNRPDGLFLERLESFIEGQQKDMEAFANREQRPLDEVIITGHHLNAVLLISEKIRKLVAIPHARYLFSLDTSLPQPDDSPQGDCTACPFGNFSCFSSIERQPHAFHTKHLSASEQHTSNVS